MPRAKELPINCATRNAVWVYPRVAPPRFPGAPAIVETARSYEMPAIPSLPDGADVAVELYGGARTLRLDGESRRVYARRFHYAGFATQEEARRAFLDLWREVERRGLSRRGRASGRAVGGAPGVRAHDDRFRDASSLSDSAGAP